MPDIQVVSRERHAGKRWVRYASYAFASTDAVAPLVIQELPKACMMMPLGFVAVEDSFMPVAVQGLTPGTNLLVAADGRWLAGYVPAAYRSYPFALANTPDGQQVLTVIEDSGLLSDTDGELFFDEDNQPSQAVKDVLNFLEQVSVNRQATRQACAALQKHNLIKPWPINLDTESGRQAVEGLYTIDEAALNQVSAEALHELRDASALLVAYCQILSTQHLQKLGVLLRAHAAQQAATLETPAGELDIEFLNDSDTINFGALR
ncbi:MAG: SapC family protein [Pusillimonas sp.]